MRVRNIARLMLLFMLCFVLVLRVNFRARIRFHTCTNLKLCLVLGLIQA